MTPKGFLADRHSWYKSIHFARKFAPAGGLEGRPKIEPSKKWIERSDDPRGPKVDAVDWVENRIRFWWQKAILQYEI